MHKPLIAILAVWLIAANFGAAGNICRAAIAESDLSGAYNWLWAGPDNGDPLAVEGSLSAADRARFDGNGGWTLPRYTGTYAINAESFLEMTIEDSTDPGNTTAYPAQKTGAGAVNPNGNLIVFADTQTAGINVLMRVVSPPATGGLSGRFNGVAISYNASNELVNRAGYAEFTPSTPGTYTFFEEYNSDEGDTVSRSSGPNVYTITEDGYFNNDFKGFISPDKNLIVATHKINKDEIVFFLRNQDEIATVDVFGRYHIVTWRHDADTGEHVYETGYLYFDGNGNWFYPAEDESGTYTVDANDRLLIDGRNTWGAVGKNGSLIVIPEPDDQPGLSVLIKAPAAGDLATIQNITATAENGTPLTAGVQKTSLTSAQLQENFGVSDLELVGEVTRIRTSISPTPEAAVITFTYEVEGLARTPADYKLIKLKSRRQHLEFSYASQSSARRGSAVDGEWWLTDTNGFYMDPGEQLDANQAYTVNFKVQDDGSYDLAADTAGLIDDPTVLGAVTETGDSDGDGSDGGGCFIHHLLP